MDKDEITTENVEWVIKQALLKYKKEGMILDVLFWQKVLSVYKQKIISYQTIDASVDFVMAMEDMDKKLIADNFFAYELPMASGNKWVWKKGAK